MAYEITAANMTDKQKTDAADYLQKLEALNGALADLQSERAAFEGKLNERIRTIEKERSNAMDALRALRPITITEIK
jgi:uncharacterized protein YlxW (UPF0749 family)